MKKHLNTTLVVSCGEIHDHDHYKILIQSLSDLADKHFVLSLELPRDFNPLIKKFIDRATSIYEKAADHKMLFEEADKKVDKLQEAMLNKMLKKSPAILSFPFDRVKKENGQWVGELRKAKRDEGIDVRLTQYGYEKHAQSKKWIGAWDNKLVAAESVAFSRDIERILKPKKGEKFIIDYGNGQQRVVRWEDRTASYLSKTVDLFVPDGYDKSIPDHAIIRRFKEPSQQITKDNNRVYGLTNFAEVLKAVAKHNGYEGQKPKIEVYAVDISTKELKAQQRKNNLYEQICLPKECQKAVNDYVIKARKSALLGKPPKDEINEKFFKEIEKEGEIQLEKEEKENLVNSINALVKKDKSISILTTNIDKSNFKRIFQFYPLQKAELGLGFNSAFLDYRDQRMAGNYPTGEDRHYGPCSIKDIARATSYHYPGPRILHWGGASHLGEMNRSTNLEKELAKAGFVNKVTADTYTADAPDPKAVLNEKGQWERHYPTDYVFESHKGLMKAVEAGIKEQQKAALSSGVFKHSYAKRKDRERD
ncbi:hypothetical protein [Methylacidiphilum caldifontis]|uniref:Uncharacterized protein n=1 Tax=Methylacidiphilum caldifontis TaxID=2795386 RepID=A0A4Y8PC61_9BACT|nr:hypothetical protein [Methylacidiphilum caldifontis]TFE68490.1 hypothetical protein A7Q10_08340 [Methylacidiphilum caldifontis]